MSTIKLQLVVDETVYDVLTVNSAVAEAPKKGGKKAAAAPESAQPAATPAAPVATAPAAAAPPAQSPAAPTFPTIETLNKAVLKLAGFQTTSDPLAGRTKAVAVLGKRGVANTAELKPEQYQAVIDDSEEAYDSLQAAAAQVSLV